MDEIESLERRIRAFSEFSSEPPVCPEQLDLHEIVEERIAFLKIGASGSPLRGRSRREHAQRAGRSGSGQGHSGQPARKCRGSRGRRRADSGAGLPDRGSHRDRSSRFRTRPERSGPQLAFPAHHLIQETRHGPRAFDRAQERSAFGRRYPADRGRTGRRRFPRSASCRAITAFGIRNAIPAHSGR